MPGQLFVFFWMGRQPILSLVCYDVTAMLVLFDKALALHSEQHQPYSEPVNIRVKKIAWSILCHLLQKILFKLAYVA